MIALLLTFVTATLAASLTFDATKYPDIRVKWTYWDRSPAFQFNGRPPARDGGVIVSFNQTDPSDCSPMKIEFDGRMWANAFADRSVMRRYFMLDEHERVTEALQFSIQQSGTGLATAALNGTFEAARPGHFLPQYVLADLPDPSVYVRYMVKNVSNAFGGQCACNHAKNALVMNFEAGIYSWLVPYNQSEICGGTTTTTTTTTTAVPTTTTTTTTITTTIPMSDPDTVASTTAAMANSFANDETLDGDLTPQTTAAVSLAVWPTCTFFALVVAAV